MNNYEYYKIITETLQSHMSKLSLEDINYLKNGGEVKRLLKKGGKNKIHIKKENRGKFTEYCGGKVTSECIQRGKNSSNPVIRKRATFAANVRKFKHQSGGILEDRSAEKQKYDEWNQLSALDKLKRNFNIARQFISESPRLENIYNAAQAMLGEYNPQNPYLITGVAPSVGRTPKIRKQSVSDINNKGLQITKKFNTSVKNGMTYEDGDIRHLNRGSRSHDAQARERARVFLVKYRAGTPEFKQYEKLTKSLAKKTDIGASTSVLNNIKRQMNDILDNLITQGYVQ